MFGLSLRCLPASRLFEKPSIAAKAATPGANLRNLRLFVFGIMISLFRLIVWGKPFDKFNFLSVKRRAVCAEYIVEPDIGLGQFAWCVPLKNGLRLSTYKSPVETPDVFFLEYRHMRLKCAVTGPCHILRAQQGTAICLKLPYFFLQVGGITIMVEGYDVRVLNCYSVESGEFLIPTP
jgi:hypothetical protein